MLVLGVHIHPESSRFNAHFAVVNGDRLRETSSYTAPASESESAQLFELFRRSSQLLDEHQPEMLAFRQVEQGPRGAKTARLAIPLRAEGAVLAAAGTRGLDHEQIASATLRAAASEDKTDTAVDSLCAELSGGEAEDCRVAAAVARLVARRSS
jgi:hypothetical protein